MAITRGLILVHSAPAYLLKQLAWGCWSTLGYEPTFSWTPQPLRLGEYRTELIWEGEIGVGANLASNLAGWKELRFEVTEESSGGLAASRWLYTPQLGIRHRATDEVGNFQISEEELRGAMHRSGLKSADLILELQSLLAEPWEVELDPLRAAGADANVVWLFRAG
jgi:Protein of unknown function (DUF3145)